MPKLRNIGTTLSIASPKLAYAQGDKRAADRSREQLAPWRLWYRTARWQRLRHEAFLRDGYVCQRSGILCIGRHPAPNSPVANHKKPHKGDPALFWDINNIETVSKQVHDSLIQAEERRAY